ncbi:MAG: hypothetical protein AUI36_15890 [Cyanobacteria bacterium 13_1_40CM_2_61_4]|nr:MAG: hypothetical protein AUI36_15890 [Cyanobacteria bacterium 13_1_40CM_2_61_4]
MKKVPQAAITGQRGINIIESIVLEMGFKWNPTVMLDSGIDGHIEIRDPVTAEAKNLVLQVQSKATMGQFAGETDTGFHYICEEDDLRYWLTGNVPVIFVRSRPSSDEAYWISVKDYFKDPATRKSRRIDFDKKKDRLAKDSADALVRLATRNVPGLVFSRPRISETLYSNLLVVSHVAPHIFVAKTALRSRSDVVALVAPESKNTRGEWLLKGGLIYALHDLAEPPWGAAVDLGTVERHDTARFAHASDADDIAIYVELLNRCLRQKTKEDLHFDQSRETLYFKPTADLTPRSVSYPGLVVESSRVVFRGYGNRRDNPKQASYYRHSAFEGQFKRLGGAWHLEITPTYRFTSDGYRLHPFHEDRQKAIKRLERNGSLVGQLLMWKHWLTRADLFVKDYPLLRFSDLASFTVPVGFRDDQWVHGEDEQGEEDDPDVDVEDSTPGDPDEKVV